MKRKSLILLPLLVLGSAAFASCEPKQPPVVVDPSKVASVEFASDADITVKMGKYAEVPAVTVLPETATDKTYSLSISDETVAVLEEEEGTWYVKGVATGTATITVKTTDGEFTDTLTVVVPERDPAPAAKVATIAELVAKSADDTENLYKVTGIATEIKGDQYGNMYLAETDGSAKIMVYGSTLAASSISWTDYTETNYVGLAFNNPKDFITGGLSAKIAEGDKITMVVVYKCYNGTDEIMGYVLEDSIVKASENAVYTASVNVTQVEGAGSATLSKETAVCWGETLTLTVATPTGSKAVVKYNGNEIVGAEGVYTVVAGATNAFTVEFVKDVAITGSVTHVLDSYFTGLGTTYVAASCIDQGVKFNADRANYSSTGSAGDGVWEGKSHLVLCANNKNALAPTTYFTIETEEKITGITLNGLSWCGSNMKVTIEYFDEATQTWVNDGALKTFANTTKVKFALDSIGTWETTKVRIKLNTTYTNNDRIGVESIVLHYGA